MYDYAIRNESYDPKAFVEKWPKIKTDILTAVKPIERDDLLKYFNDDIGYFLALLKLLLPRGSNLESAVSKFIVYSDVSFFSNIKMFILEFEMSECLCIYRISTMIHIILSIRRTNIHISLPLDQLRMTLSVSTSRSINN